MPLWLTPLLVGSVTDQLGFSEHQAAFMASADVAGVLLAIILALAWIKTVSWRTVAYVATLLLLLTNLISAQVQDFSTLFVLRLLAGFMAGSLMAICGAVLGGSAQPERNIALFTGLQLTTAALLLLLLPSWIITSGTYAIYMALSGLIVVCLALLVFVPTNSTQLNYSRSRPATSGNEGRKRWLILAAVLPGLLFHVGVAAIWAFSERLAGEFGLDALQTGQALSVAMFAGILGSTLAYLAGQRLGDFLPFTVVLILQIIALVLLLSGNPGFTEFLLAMALLGVSFNLVVSYQFGLAVRLVANPRTPVAYLIMVKTGMVCGPLLGSMWLVSSSHSPVLWIAGVFFGFSFLVSCWLLTYRE